MLILFLPIVPVEVARDVKAVYYNSTAITVHFTPVENTLAAMRGVLKGYRVCTMTIISSVQFRIQTLILIKTYKLLL